MLTLLVYSSLFLMLCPGLNRIAHRDSTGRFRLRSVFAPVQSLRRRRALRVIVTLMLLYLSLAPRITPWPYEHFLFKNRQVRMLDDSVLVQSLSGPQYSQVTLADEDWETDHGTLHVARLLNRAGRFDVVVLVSQGIAGNIAGHHQLLELLVKASVREVVIYEPRGFGRSHFQPWSSARIPTYFGGLEHVSLASDLEDARDMFALVRSHSNGKPIIWWGESFGASVVSFLATHQPAGVRGVILQGGFKSLADIGYDKPLPNAPFNPCRLFPRWLFPTEFNTGHWLAGTHAPVLLMHGAHDSIVPLNHASAIAALASSPCRLVVLPNSLHVDLPARDEPLFISALTEFFGTLPCAP